jgi:ethanolamine transporter
MMGPTIVFTIPVALGIISKEDRNYLGAGVLAGMITIPVGCIVGGLAMSAMTSYKIGFGTIMVNLIPVIVIAALIVIGLWVAPAKMIAGFNVFGNGVTIVITIFTAIAIFQQITGIMFPLFYVMSTPAEATGTTPLNDGLLVCGQIGIVLVGAFPMVEWITRTFGSVLKKLGGALGINEQASAGMVANLANNIAMFNIMGEMDPKGKILNVAFAVSAAFVFGDHLGFTAGVNQEMVTPVIIGKLVAGITALIVANILAPKLLEKIKSAK